MGDGWETRRRRGPGHDWVIVRLGHPGTIERVELDTAHFKGNYPDRCSLQAKRLDAAEAAAPELAAASAAWPALLGERKLEADRIHAWTHELERIGPVSHVRLNIHPDGGVSRLRLFGRVDAGRGRDPAAAGATRHHRR
jgi:allantoicase